MKVAFVNTGTIQQNASTLRCVRLGEMLVRDGHQASIFITGQPANRELYGECFRGITMHYSTPGRLKEQCSKIRMLAAEEFDAIHCMSSGTSVQFPGWCAKVRFRHRPKLIMDFDEWQSLWHTQPRKTWQASWEKFACLTSDMVLFASKYLLDHLGRKLPDSRKLYFPYAVDAERFEQDVVGWEAIRNRYPERKLIVYMGSLRPQFNADRVLDVIKPVTAADPSVLFIFVGDGPLRNAYEQRVKNEGLEKSVIFTGFAPDADVPKYLRAAHATVFPIEDTVLNRSRSPNKTFQYLAGGRPIVTNRVGNVADVLGDNALYFDFNSSPDLVEKLQKALAPNAPVAPPECLEQNTFQARYRVYKEMLHRLGVKGVFEREGVAQKS